MRTVESQAWAYNQMEVRLESVAARIFITIMLLAEVCGFCTERAWPEPKLFKILEY